MIKKILGGVALIFVTLTSSFSGDISKKVLWSIKEIVPKQENHYYFEVKAQINKGYWMYDSVSNIKEVNGIKWQLGIPFAILSRHQQIGQVKDNFFSNKKINALYETNTWLVEISKQEKIDNIAFVISYNIFNETAFFQENDTLYLKKQAVVNALKIPAINYKKPLNQQYVFENTSSSSTDSFWTIFLLGIMSGLISLLTPCVFPMIPLTISFFGKKSDSKKQSFQYASIYGLSIIGIYFLVSIPFHLIDNISPDFLNNLATNVYLNGFFFILMIVFGVSFLGFFEIQLPDKLVNFADSKAGLQKKIGIFFMAFTLCIVSFSCTGPILGTLLANTLNGSNGAWNLSYGLIGFGIGMGAPFGILALFPNLLHKLPKSGNWMNEFKKFLAILEFALALKFLSNVDLVLHLGILKREVFLGLWALLALGYGVYLLFSNTKQHIFGGIKRGVGVFFIAFGIYLSFGVSKQGYEKSSFFSWLSNGILPPHFYSFYAAQNECPLSLNCVKTYQEAVSLSQQLQKPILIDFTGWACVNCRKMEENVWSVLEVNDFMKNHFILLSLYVDDRTPLKQPYVIELYHQHKKIETIGDENTYFQLLNFENNAQPLYAILNSQEQLLIPTIGYTPDQNEFKKWLELGVATYKQHP